MKTKKTRAIHVRTVLVFCLEMRDKYRSCVEIQIEMCHLKKLYSISLSLSVRIVVKEVNMFCGII